MTRLHKITGTAIVGAWLLSLGKGVFVNDWQGMPYTTPIMFIFAGYLYGDSLLKKRYADD